MIRVEVYPVEDKRKDKSSKFLPGLKSKRDKSVSQTQSSEKHSKLIDTVRIQMQASTRMLFSNASSGYISLMKNKRTAIKIQQNFLD